MTNYHRHTIKEGVMHCTLKNVHLSSEKYQLKRNGFRYITTRELRVHRQEMKSKGWTVIES